MERRERFSGEVRERAVWTVQEHQAEHESQWAAICSIAEKIGCSVETLRRWVRRAERDRGEQPRLTTVERERMEELERENRELHRANEILRKASAYFAQRSSTAVPLPASRWSPGCSRASCYASPSRST